MTHLKTPVHPGQTLARQLKAIRMSPIEVAKRIGVPNTRLYSIMDGRRSLTADTALRLGRFFNTSAEYWLNLQQEYELDKARQELGTQLEDISPYQAKQEINVKT